MRRALPFLLLAACTTYLPPEAPSADRERAADTLRVVSWNIETIGDVGSPEYDAALAVLGRLDADVVALQEVEWSTDEHSLHPFAAAAGYDHVVSGWPVSFGDDTQVILSRWPVVHSALLDGDDLSGDPTAVDLTRAIPVATLDIDGTHLTLGTAHFKASEDTEDHFRRTIDAYRAAQALGPFDPATDRVLFCGDLNDDLGDPAPSPSTWSYAPNGLPSTYSLGQDLHDQMTTVGLVNSAFVPLTDMGLTVLDAVQRSGEDLTRPASGRRLDYLLVSDPLLGGITEVYDTDDEGLPGLPLSGDVPSIDVLDAADHLPVVVDLPWAGLPGEPTEPTEPTEPEPLTVDALDAGDLRITEVFANPGTCPDAEGEWVELINLSGEAVDLTGLDLCDAVSCTEVEGAGVVEAGGVVLLGRTASACGIPVSGTFGRPLNNTGDTVSLETDLVIDEVSFGRARVDRSWVFGEQGRCRRQPTPGEAVDCAGEPWLPEDETGPTTVQDVPMGQLVLTEVFANPVGCIDEENEWIEVLNDGDRDVDLSDLHFADAHGIPERLDTTHVLAAGERAVFARSWSACDVPEVHGTFQAALSNGGDELTLQRPDGEVLAHMTYPYGPAGDSWVEEGGTWCRAEATPGAPEASCW